MGMFDDVVCKRVMPDGLDGRDHGFQTKDLDCEMGRVEITDAGRLVQVHKNWEDNTRHDTDLNFHGWLRFYTFIGSDPEAWHEYRAKFTDGNLVDLVAAPSE